MGRVPWVGFPGETHRALPRVKGSPAADGGNVTPLCNNPLADAPGRSISILAEQARERGGITPPGFSAKEPLEKPDNTFTIGPRPTGFKGSGTYPRAFRLFV